MLGYSRGTYEIKLRVMDARQFFNLVSEMRNKQKEYFRTRTQSALKESKALEKRVDDEIERVGQVLKEKKEPRLTGF